MTEFTDTFLNDELEKFVQEMYNYNVYQAYSFDVLFKTGCRPFELFQPSRWTTPNQSEATLQPGKGNNLRTILRSELTDLFFESIEFNTFIFSKVSLDSLQRSFDHIFGYRPSFIKRIDNYQPIGIYLFRHNRIKQKFNELLSIHDVSLFFGEKDDKNTEGYIYSSLFYD